MSDELERFKQEMGIGAAKPRYALASTGQTALSTIVSSQPKPTRTTEAVLKVLNDRHAIIENIGSKTMISGWEPSALDPNRMEIVFQKRNDFLLRYSNQFVPSEYVDEQTGETKTRSTPLGQWWLGHRHRKQYRGVTFLPEAPAVVNDCLNLWRGWGVTPVQGDWGLLREHLLEVIAGGNAEIGEYLIKWLAWIIQNPAHQAEVALVLIGEKGTGKGTVGRVLQKIFGDHAMQVTSNDGVIGKFNGHLQDCIVLLADEAYWGGDKRCIGRLQGMITEPTITVERKGVDAYQVPNRLHIIMMAEPGWVIPAGRYERRYAAMEVSIHRRGDISYFKAVHNQINNGGAAAMFFDLQVLQLDDWHPRQIPAVLRDGDALRKQQGLSLPPLDQWYLGLLHDGRLPGAVHNKPNKTLTTPLREDAQKKFPRLRWDLSDAALRNFLVESSNRIGISCDKYRTSSANGWSFPLLSECREAWESIHGHVDWEDPDAEWGGASDSEWPPKVPEGLLTPRAAKFDLKSILDAAELAKPSTAAEANPPQPKPFRDPAQFPSWRRI